MDHGGALSLLKTRNLVIWYPTIQGVEALDWRIHGLDVFRFTLFTSLNRSAMGKASSKETTANATLASMARRRAWLGFIAHENV